MIYLIATDRPVSGAKGCGTSRSELWNRGASEMKQGSASLLKCNWQGIRGNSFQLPMLESRV